MKINKVVSYSEAQQSFFINALKSESSSRRAVLLLLLWSDIATRQHLPL